MRERESVCVCEREREEYIYREPRRQRWKLDNCSGTHATADCPGEQLTCPRARRGGVDRRTRTRPREKNENPRFPAVITTGGLTGGLDAIVTS